MKNADSIFKRYGSVARIKRDGRTHSFRAIIQPLRYKYKSYYPNLRLPTGYYDSGHFLMLAQTGTTLNDYLSEVESEGVLYSVRNSGSYKVGKNEIYVWAVLTACTPEAEDEYDEID